MNQLIFIFSGLIFIAGVIILTGHLNRLKHRRSSLATPTDATTEQVEQFVRENLGKWASCGGWSGYVCGYRGSDVIFGRKKSCGWTLIYDADVIIKPYKSYLYSCCDGNLSLIKITEKP